MKQKFSVSMCVYGKDDPEWFRVAVESILNQTVKPNEVVLVVDGSVPESLDRVISAYERKRFFKVIRLKQNQGHGNARRVGLSNCSYDLVAMMDADDISAPDRFEKLLGCFREENPDVVGSQISEFLGTPENIVGKRIVPLSDEKIKIYMKKRCPMNLVSVMLKKSSVEKAGGFIDWFREEDYYLWVRMALAGMKFSNVDELLVNVRVGEKMYQRRGGWKYFKSEKRLQCFMKKNGIIGLWTYLINVTERFILQVLMPNRLRGIVFQTFAREK